MGHNIMETKDHAQTGALRYETACPFQSIVSRNVSKLPGLGKAKISRY